MRPGSAAGVARQDRPSSAMSRQRPVSASRKRPASAMGQRPSSAGGLSYFKHLMTGLEGNS